jgi:hypothetical protein
MRLISVCSFFPLEKKNLYKFFEIAQVFTSSQLIPVGMPVETNERKFGKKIQRNSSENYSNSSKSHTIFFHFLSATQKPETN